MHISSCASPPLSLLPLEPLLPLHPLHPLSLLPLSLHPLSLHHLEARVLLLELRSSLLISTAMIMIVCLCVRFAVAQKQLKELCSR
jgi:hypothetical protein